MNIKTIQLGIKGMTCDHCATTIANVLDIEGVVDKSVSYPDGSAQVTFDSAAISEDDIVDTINSKTHYHVTDIQSSENSGLSASQHLIIIGGGSAAFAATIEAHELGARVTMINDGLPIGGTCVNVGCVPSKNLIRAAEALHRAEHNPFPGITTTGRLADFKALRDQKSRLVQDLRQEKYINIVKDMDRVRIISGRGRVVSPTTVEVNGERITGDKLLIATGARPHIPPIPGLKDVPFLTNEGVFELDRLPESVLILGGRFIALEIAQMLSRLGSRVTVLQRSDRILPDQSPELTAALTSYLEAEGLTIVTGNQFTKVSQIQNQIEVESMVAGRFQTFTAHQLVVATGRTPNTTGMGLEELGLNLTPQGAIVVDDTLQTSIPGIYAVGDVLGQNMFVYTAAYEGKLAARNALTDSVEKTDYSVLPWVIFTDPQVAGVGLDEAQAKEKGLDVEAVTLPLSYVPRSIVARDTRGFIQLIRNTQNDQLVGARILAPEGAELIMEVSLAIKFGITVREIIGTFHPYLTLAEGVKLAAITFGKDVKTLSCCAT